jgi:hypothetical protein
VTKLIVAYRYFSRKRLKVNILCKGTWNISSWLRKAGNVLFFKYMPSLYPGPKRSARTWEGFKLGRYRSIQLRLFDFFLDLDTLM